MGQTSTWQTLGSTRSEGHSRVGTFSWLEGLAVAVEPH